MRRLSRLLCFCAFLFFFGCGESIEEIWINADGDGTIHKKIDMGELIDLIKLGMIMDEESDSSEIGSEDLSELLEEGRMDTLIYFEDFFKQAAAEYGEEYSRIWAREKFLEEVGTSVNHPDSLWELIDPFLDAKLRAVMDIDQEILELVVMLPIRDFNKMGKVDFKSLMSGMDEKVGEDIPFDLGILSPNLDYTYTVRRNQIKVEIPHYDTTSQESAGDMAGMFGEMFMEGSDKKLIIHVPGKVKSLNQPSASYNQNKVIYEIEFSRLVDYSDNLDLIIDFKPKRKLRNIAPN